MVTVENEENEENNKTIISSIVYSEEERIKIANTDTSVYRVGFA